MTTTLPSLDQSRDLLLPGLQAAVARIDPQAAVFVRYHLGFTDRYGSPENGPGGKAIRPALALLGAEATGHDRADAAPAAAAVELIHNFSLIHDDLMDRDATRRHRPTVWALWGDGAAVLAGDAMLSVAYESLFEAPTPHTAAAARLLGTAVQELIAGQVADLAFETRSRVSLAECEQMAAGKTAALLSASSAIGAVLCGADDLQVAALAEYGRQLGMAFQLVDDVLGLWGDPSVTGKPVYSDLRQHKKTLPITWAIENGGSAGEQLAACLADDDACSDADAIARAAALVEETGGRRWAEDEARRRVTDALAALDRIAMPAPCRTHYESIARFVVERNR